MKKILVIILPFFMLIMSIASKAQTHSLTNEQKDFVEIMKAILMDKEINTFTEHNDFLCSQVGKNYVFILFNDTPFEGTDYEEKYFNKILKFVSDNDVFFCSANNIVVENFSIVPGKAKINLFFRDNINNKTSFSKEFNLTKDKTWKLVN